MKIIFSRKGFDSSAGGSPSPTVDGHPVSLPIPARAGPSATSYGDLGLGDHVRCASRGRLGAESPCHHVPIFLPGGRALLGQCGAAQTHQARGGVGEGDLFLFFGLFKEAGKKPHQRIFGYLKADQAIDLATAPGSQLAELAARKFPHALALHSFNDTVYRGVGRAAQAAHSGLRLTVLEGPPSLWQVPSWLAETGLTYHPRAERWLPGNRLRSAARGQEFIADIGESAVAHEWVCGIVALIQLAPAMR